MDQSPHISSKTDESGETAQFNCQPESQAILNDIQLVAVAVRIDSLDVDPADCMIIGDNPDTDIEMGRRAGLTTVLVLTGLVDRTDPVVAEDQTDYVIDSLGELSDMF